MCEHELCPLEHLKEHFHESINNCDYANMCSLDSNVTDSKGGKIPLWIVHVVGIDMAPKRIKIVKYSTIFVMSLGNHCISEYKRMYY